MSCQVYWRNCPSRNTNPYLRNRRYSIFDVKGELQNIFPSNMKCVFPLFLYALIHELSAWRKLLSPKCVTELRSLKGLRGLYSSVLNTGNCMRATSYSVYISVCLFSSSRWTWRRSWLWQMGTWRSWALKQTDPDNRSWLPYQSLMQERCIWLNIYYASSSMFPGMSARMVLFFSTFSFPQYSPTFMS